ncbi:UDP-N-acetylmuramoylalanyl-D-glutamyl-2,6-diaminopimelate--D-alanyl-D-alanine ligase [Aquibium oceanicum]|uniref:UDP-N-acetylmuramoyl-tripeptide--D-alanyl-D-alanine ligase n=1 Tax=Aquibium oceanicum TaxID=1670800 RepID=A0A1L3STQ3_9HYPH|nr:UDP-N-acetylmuramoylalanyl-D-glutamyl-2,6-diaminopimelate--D-alanyl-D-alanine ligase [Aquibium oceanicum]APH72774.1 UDP-N-acetylmuramoylalanyl-D-glutamyl-2, 6-diaminopimelate--D-alanyl-D-alanine ligase [Aquibium oceanicum]
MSALWTSEAMVAAMGGRPLGNLPREITGISIDTRTLAQGEAFFAIKGENFDGHDFATAAMAAGAGLMVVAEDRLASLGRLTMPMIVVEDVLHALELLGAAARARSNAKVIAVTGSAGKTSTKEALRLALSPSGKVHAAERSFNNHWGVPLTLARMPQDTDYAVYEIGMNHPGEIRPLVKLVQPHVAIVTMIAAAHLGFFHSLDDIARAKGEIFEGVTPGGHALVNRDDHRWRILEKLAKEAGVKHVHGFGEHSRANYKLLQCDLHADYSMVTIRVGGDEVSVRIGAPGRHVVQNVLAVFGAVHLAGADVAAAAAAMANLKAERGRGARTTLRHPDGPFLVIDESYNANPASMKAAIDLLSNSEAPGGRRIAVLGDMLELGSHSERLHSALAEVIRASRIERLYLAGTEMAALRDKLGSDFPVEYREKGEELLPLVVSGVGAGDAIMIKSSNGIGFSRIVDALAARFPGSGAGPGGD